jgi:hypothetical protein
MQYFIQSTGPKNKFKMKELSIISLLLFIYISSFSQKAKDILERGIPVKSGNILIFKFDSASKTVQYDIVASLWDINHPVNFTTMEDSVILLSRKNELKAYLRPINPLSYFYDTESKLTNNQVNESLEKPGELLTTTLGGLITGQTKTETKAGVTKTVPITEEDICDDFNKIQANLANLKGMLNESQKDKINEIFTTLKNMKFNDENTTVEELKKASEDLTVIRKHFNEITITINETTELITGYKCTIPNLFTTRYIFELMLKDMSASMTEQMKRLISLQQSYDIVKTAQELASAGGDEPGLKWCFKLKKADSPTENTNNYSVFIKESGYKLSDKKEIISVDSKDVIRRTARIVRFNRFIPEVSVGTAYTFFQYNVYGTTSDSTGKQFVAAPSKKSLKNLNISTMINFTYFTPDWLVLPFWQLGLGFNSEVPTLLTGFGLRGVLGSKRICIAGGLAMSWIKELDKLKVGDKISGTSDIDKDLKSQFSWPPKPYVGLQYNF